MANELNIREVSGCTCLRARRTTRQLTQIYDRELEPAGVTINQFGLLAKPKRECYVVPRGLTRHR
jgi:hypothetical protein